MRSRFIFGGWFTVNFFQIYATTIKVQQTQLQLFFFDIDSDDVSCIISQKTNKHTNTHKETHMSLLIKKNRNKIFEAKHIEYNLK